MNRRFMPFAMVASAALILTIAAAFAQPKGPKITVKGEVVDLWCYLEGGDHGAKHKACSTACAKAGNPIGILDSKGNLYVAMGIKDHQPAKDVLINKMNETGIVSGTLVKK